MKRPQRSASGPAGPVTEYRGVMVALPAALARRLERVAPSARLDGLVVAAVGEFVDRIERAESGRDGDPTATP